MGFLSALAPFAPAIGGGLGGISSYFGQRDTNRMNLAIARENRAWQERMSNTANQRAAKDLEAAGLNRILALGKPATTPAGNIATMQNPAAAAAAGFANMAGSVSQLRTLEANLDAIQSRANLTDRQAEALGALAEMGSAGGELLRWAKRRLEQVDWPSVVRELKSDMLSMFGVDPTDTKVEIILDFISPTAAKGYKGITEGTIPFIRSN